MFKILWGYWTKQPEHKVKTKTLQALTVQIFYYLTAENQCPLVATAMSLGTSILLGGGKKKKKIRKWKETLTKCKVSTCQLYSCCSWNCPHCINSYVKILNMCSINKKQKSKIHASEEIPVSLLTSINCFSINKVVKPSIYKTRFKCETCALLPDYLACHE